MSVDLLEGIRGTGILKNERTGVQIEGYLHMTYLLELQCVPRFKFYPCSLGSIELSKFLSQRKEIGPEFTMLQATTSEGDAIRIEGIDLSSYHVSSCETEQSCLEFRAQEVLIGKEEAASEIKFYIPNLEFWGTEWSTLPDNIHRADKSTVEFEDYLIEIRQIPDYRNVISELQSAHEKVAITSVITLRHETSPVDVAHTVELMDVLNELLNLAMGRFVFWPKCEGYKEGKLVWKKLRSRRLHQFGPCLGFLGSQSDPRALKQFVSSSLDNFDKWFSKNRTIARRIVHSYLWGLNLPLYETEIYSLSYALELLVNRYLEPEQKKSYRIDDKKTLMGDFKQFVQEKVISKIVDEEKDRFRGNELKNKVGNFFSRPFREKIMTLLKESQDEWDGRWDEWISSFVKVRNSVVHDSKTSEAELLRAWFQGRELIELIFLGKGWLSIEHRQSKITPSFLAWLDQQQ